MPKSAGAIGVNLRIDRVRLYEGKTSFGKLHWRPEATGVKFNMRTDFQQRIKCLVIT